jgi:hypothetical protein
MEEFYSILEENLPDAIVVSVDNGALCLRLEDGREVEIFLDDDQVEEIVTQLSEDDIEEQ